MPDARTKFIATDWSAPLDLPAQIAATPADAKIRGMFFQFVLDAIGASAAASLKTGRHLAFKHYPMREFVELVMLACAKATPDLPLRQAVRQLGHNVYPSFAATMVGTAIFAVAGRSFASIAELAPRAYGVSLDPGRVQVVSLSSNHVRVALRDMWMLADCFQIGIWEGALRFCSVVGEIKVHTLAIDAVDFDITWQPRADLTRPSHSAMR